MRIESIYIENDLFERKIDFSSSVNLIHSKRNSCGKTTLLRFILYALGYQIPSTKKIKFGQCNVTLKIWCEKQGELILERNNVNMLRVTMTDKKQRVYILPNQEDELHALIFSTQEPDILHNLLGSFYIDQEKGWTLLNRGVVIGSIHFNIEELVRGLSGIDCKDLIAEEKELLRQIAKYKEMASVAAYREQLQQELGSVGMDSYEEQIDTELDLLTIKQKQLKKELNRIDTTLTDNKKFQKFIAEIKLLVRGPHDEVIKVTKDNIIGLNDSIDLLITKSKLIARRLHDVDNKIAELSAKRIKENEQIDFIKELTPIEVFDKAVSRIPLDSRMINRQLTSLIKRRKQISEEISKTTSMNNSISKEISDAVIAYTDELNVNDKISPNYIFTSNLKELSGAYLHKTVFAFRMAYIKAIEKKLHIKLPIILDSPSGKEVDRDNIDLMMRILQRDFADHQIIIASIFDYYFDDFNSIEIKDQLLNMKRSIGS